MLFRSHQAEKKSWLGVSTPLQNGCTQMEAIKLGAQVTMLYNFGDLKAISLHKTLDLGNFYCQSAASRTSPPPNF
jgi:hypothetical protein